MAVSSGYTLEGGVNYAGGTSEGGAMAYQIQTTAAAANPKFSWTNGQYANAVIMSFK